MNIDELTHRYVEKFNKKMLKDVVEMFHIDGYILDPNRKHSGHKEIKDEISKIFSHDDLFLQTKKVFCDHKNNTTFLEFSIKVNDNNLSGVDIILWEEEKIKEMRAYVYLEK